MVRYFLALFCCLFATSALAVDHYAIDLPGECAKVLKIEYNFQSFGQSVCVVCETQAAPRSNDGIVNTVDSNQSNRAIKMFLFRENTFGGWSLVETIAIARGGAPLPGRDYRLEDR